MSDAGLPPPPPNMRDARGFFSSLFDFSFSSFITTKILGIIYGIAMVGIALFTLIFIAGAFRANAAAGLFMLLIGGPLFFLLYVIMTRVWLEFLAVVFRIAENVGDIARSK